MSTSRSSRAVREDGKNTHRTLARLGEVSELRASGQLDRIIKALRTYAEGSWFEAGELSGEGGPNLGGVAACYTYFRRLGLEAHLDAVGRTRRFGSLSDAVFVMLANCLVDPGSKRRTITEWLATVALPKERRRPKPRPLLPGRRRARCLQRGDREPSLLRALQLDEPRSPVGLSRPDVDLLRDGRSRRAEVLLARLRLQPRPPKRPSPGRDRPPRHR